MKSQIKRTIAILLLVCFFISITITAVSATSTTQKITVVTGSAKDAGTDANVYITLYGTKGNSGEMLLDNSANNFEIGSTDEFYLETKDLGRIDYVIIRHDNSERNPGWQLETIRVQSPGHDRLFPYHNWLARDVVNGKTQRTLYIDHYT